MKNNTNTYWQKEDTTDVGIKVILFLISPVVAFVYSLRRLNTKSSYWVSFFAALCYGLCITVGVDRDIQSSDAVAYRILFENYCGSDVDQFLKMWYYFIGFNTSMAKDIYSFALAFVVTRFSNNYHVFFLCAAAVFSFFQLRSFRFFTSNNQFKNSFVCLLLAGLFLFNGISNVSGVRFWTTMWVAVYSALQIFVNHNKNFLGLAAITPIMHSAYWVFLIVILLTYLLGRFRNFWIFFLWMSTALSVFASSILLDLSPYLPETIANSIEAYTQVSYFDINGPVKSFFAIMVTLYINVLFMVLIYSGNTEKDSKLFDFTIIFLSLTNMCVSIPSLGTRFQIVILPFIALLWLKAFGDKKYSFLVLLFPLVFFFKYFEYFRSAFGLVGTSFLYASPIAMIKNALF